MKNKKRNIIIIIVVLLLLLFIGVAYSLTGCVRQIRGFISSIENITSQPTPTPIEFTYTYTVLLDDFSNVETELDLEYQIPRRLTVTKVNYYMRLEMDKNHNVNLSLGEAELDNYVRDETKHKEAYKVISANENAKQFLGDNEDFYYFYYLLEKQNYVIVLMCESGQNALFCIYEKESKQMCYMAEINLSGIFRFSYANPKMEINNLQFTEKE